MHVKLRRYSRATVEEGSARAGMQSVCVIRTTNTERRAGLSAIARPLVLYLVQRMLADE